MDYGTFLASKEVLDADTGITTIPPLNPMLFDFQRDITNWALHRGRAAVFADCGMGKTPIQLEWAKHVHEHTGRGILIVAPLAVSRQTVREGAKFNVPMTACQTMEDFKGGIGITNYERIHHFDPGEFGGVVLDESSILKSYTGKFRTHIIQEWGNVPFRLACTATPAPNDFVELGNHAEFLGIMTRAEMLSMFFIHDGGETQKWRIKGHAQNEYWRWVCTWAVMLRKPSDLGYDDGAFILPPLEIHEHVIPVSNEGDNRKGFFSTPAATLRDRQKARKHSIGDRSGKAAALVNTSDDTWLVWCG